jgi:hypothetical protein
MPEYLSVEAYSSYPEETLSPFLDDSRQLLENLGYAGKDRETWLTQIAWESDGSGFVSSLEPLAVLEKVVVNGRALFAKPIVNGWTQETIPQLQEAWVCLTLAFETQTRRQNLDTVNSFSEDYSQNHRYQLGVGKGAWLMMHQCAAIFPQTLVYFTNELQTGKSWNALLTSQKGLWEFEVALIPHNFAARFTPIPDQFAHIHLPEGVGFARTSCWSILPWEE